jgi:hypothetical protein
MLTSVSRVAGGVAQMDWTLLVANCELITSDRGLAIWDPELFAEAETVVVAKTEPVGRRRRGDDCSAALCLRLPRRGRPSCRAGVSGLRATTSSALFDIARV